MNSPISNPFKDAHHDTVNSRYKHKIFFMNNIILTGYSKKVGMREKYNDVDNFINYVLRLVKNDYYPGSKRDIESIPFYANAEDELIVTLVRGRAQWSPKYALDKTWKRAHSVLDTIFVFLEKGLSPDQIDSTLRVKVKPKVVFDPSDLSFIHTSERALRIYANDLIKLNYPIGEVESYYRNYIHKHFNQ